MGPSEISKLNNCACSEQLTLLSFKIDEALKIESKVKMLREVWHEVSIVYREGM